MLIWDMVLQDVDGDGDEDVIATLDGDVVVLRNRIVGDSNDDGVFDSTDLTSVLQAGKYEDGIDNNATFDEGDWNHDGDFDSSDLVAAFQAGHYEAAPRALEAEIAAAIDLAFADDDKDRAKAFVP